MARRRFWQQFFFTSERRDFTFLFLSTALIVVFILFELRPLLTSVWSAYQELQAGQTYEAALTQKIEAMGQAKKSLAGVANRMNEIEVAIPTGSSQPKLLQEFSLDTGRSGVKITSLFFREKKITDRVEAESFSLTVSGAEERLGDFLRALEKDRLIKFERIQVIRRKEEGNETFLTTVEGDSFSIP